MDIREERKERRISEKRKKIVEMKGEVRWGEEKYKLKKEVRMRKLERKKENGGRKIRRIEKMKKNVKRMERVEGRKVKN